MESKNHLCTHFEPGRLMMTPNVAHTLDAEEVHSCIVRHLYCDWGDVSDADWRANNIAAANDERIVSEYRIHNQRLLIITEDDRSLTTLMLTNEY